MFPFTINTYNPTLHKALIQENKDMYWFLMNKHDYILPLLPSGGTVLNLKTETKVLFTTTERCANVTHKAPRSCSISCRNTYLCTVIGVAEASLPLY